MTLQFPKVHTDSLNKVFVSFYIGGKRYRLYNGKRINSSTDPNSYPPDQRLSIAKVLAAEIYSYLINGGVLLFYRSSNVMTGKRSDIDYIKQALDSKLAGDYSKKYKAFLKSSLEVLTTRWVIESHWCTSQSSQSFNSINLNVGPQGQGMAILMSLVSSFILLFLKLIQL